MMVAMSTLDRPPVTVVGGVGSFVSWDGGCLFIGQHVQVVPLHAHYAIQVVFGSEPGVRLRTSEREEWRDYGGAIVPSRQPHSMDASRMETNAVLFVEPETREGRALAELYLHDGIAALPHDTPSAARAAMFTAWQERRSAATVAATARQLVHELTGGVEPGEVSDERILRAIAYIRGHLDSPLTLETVAAEAYLSPSRFRHLFVEQTGMALRPYILWRRFLRVWELVTAGQSLSSAAHRAGFADAAHLTRTSRRMFGFPPSAMITSAAKLPPDTAEMRLPTMMPAQRTPA
jgi:AraC family transcriptional regulator